MRCLRVCLACLALVVAGACKNASGPTPDCANFVRDGNETDVDCGGSMCTACGDGKHCKVDKDCISLLCNSDGVCSAASCSDGIKNGSETDIDCGGPDCPACAIGKTCSAGNDCVTMDCMLDAGLGYCAGLDD